MNIQGNHTKAKAVQQKQESYSTYQHTFCHDISCRGIGIHSGKQVQLNIKPASIDRGITFKRVDLPGQPEIPATYKHVISTQLCTRIGLSEEVSVATIEHLMSALAAFEIDNAIIEINGPEVPIMDGSSAPFVALFQCAGRQAQDKERKYLRIKQPVVLEDGPKKLALLPANHLTVNYQSYGQSPVAFLNNQAYSYHHSWSAFKQEVSSARTFGFYEDVARLQANGLGLGGSLDNTVVLKEGNVMNDDGLRFDNEFARHKALDALGDVYLLGLPLLADFYAIGGGHTLNARLIETLIDDPEAFEIGTLAELSHKSPESWGKLPYFIYATWPTEERKEAVAS